MDKKTDDLEEKVDLLLENIAAKEQEHLYQTELEELRQKNKTLEGKVRSLSPSLPPKNAFDRKIIFSAIGLATIILGGYYSLYHFRPTKRAETEYQQALSLSESGGYSTALFHLNEAATLYPEKYQEPLRDIHQAIRRNPKDHLAYPTRGRILLALAHCASTFIPQDDLYVPYNRETFNFKICEPYRKAGTIAQAYDFYILAITDFTTSISLQSDNHDAYLERGMALAVINRHQEAIGDFTKAIDVHHPRDCTEGYFKRAEAYTALNRYAEAIDDYNIVIMAEPAYVEAYRRRATLWKVTNEAAKAAQDESTARNLELGLEKK